MQKITVETFVRVPLEKAWRDFNDPELAPAWNTASPDWHTTSAANDLRSGGSFSYRMEAKDGSAGFDFTGTYADVVEHERYAYIMDDGRTVQVSFVQEDGGTRITETFDPETENPPEFQRQGWQAILDSFTAFVEREGA